MKKFLAMFLALAMIFSLAACGKEETKPAEPAVQSANEKVEKWNPSKSVTMIVPWSAGGGSDLAVRTLQPYLEKELGVSMTVVNSTGANGWIAWSQLLAAKPDGLTIAQMNIPTIYSCYLDPQQKRPENLESFAWVANEVSDWGCLVVKGDDKRFNTLQEFIDYAMKNEVLAGDNGVGTNKQLLAESMIKNFPGIKITEVHQSGWKDTYSAILGGHIDVGWASVGECLQEYKNGNLKVLCVFATSRSSLLPDVPTFNELMPGYDITSPSDRGFCLPAGVEQNVYDRWVEVMEKCINNPEFIQKMEDLGQAINYIGGEDFHQYAKDQEVAFSQYAEILGWK